MPKNHSVEGITAVLTLREAEAGMHSTSFECLPKLEKLISSLSLRKDEAILILGSAIKNWKA